MAQLVERVLGKDEVTGSNPVISSIKTPDRTKKSGRVFFVFRSCFFRSAFSLKQNALTQPLTTRIHDLN